MTQHNTTRHDTTPQTTFLFLGEILDLNWEKAQGGPQEPEGEFLTLLLSWWLRVPQQQSVLSRGPWETNSWPD